MKNVQRLFLQILQAGGSASQRIRSLKRVAVRSAVVASLGVISLSAQQAVDAPPAASAAVPQLRAENPTSGTVGPGDLIDLSVSDCPELTRPFRVDADGTLSLPFLRSAVNVKGKTVSSVAEAVRSALVQQGVLKEPLVIASVREYQSNPVSVVGAVNHPLSFQLAAPITLVNAIARAGGLTPSAGSSIIVTSLHGEGKEMKATALSVPTTALLKATSPEANLVLTGGEEIRVEEASKCFVAGNVRHPGMLTMQADADMSVIKAIAMSEGLGPYPAQYGYIYRTRQPGQPREEVPFELHKVMAHKKPDVPMQPDDILYIPESSGKKLTTKMIAQITGFAVTAGSGILIFH